MRGKIDPKCYNHMDKVPCGVNKNSALSFLDTALTMNCQSGRLDTEFPGFIKAG